MLNRGAGAKIPNVHFDRVVVLPKCLSVMRAESRAAHRIETGGPLVGYVEGGLLIVTGAAGPGPKSKLERYSVTIDGEYAQKYCDQVRRDSNGLADYVGDWHKHTGISLKPSPPDIFAIKTMANFEFSPTKNPISLIYRRWPEAMRVYFWNGKDALIEVPVETKVTQ